MNKPLNLPFQTFYLFIGLILSTPASANTSVSTASDSPAMSNSLSTDSTVTVAEVAPRSNASTSSYPKIPIQSSYQTAQPVTQPLPQQGSAEKHWTDEERTNVQNHLHQWANTINGWFGKPNPQKPATANLRVILDTRWVDDPIEGSHITLEPRVRGRLRLPVLEERLSLIIGDDNLDNETMLRQDSTGKAYYTQTSSQDKIVDRKKVRDDNASIALRWSRFGQTLDDELGVKTDIDIGVRSGGDVYLKVSVDKDLYEDDKVVVSSDNFYRYGLDSEHYARAGLNLKYGNNDSRFMNNRTTINYRHQDDDERTDWRNDLRQVHNFANNKQLSYGISAGGDFGDDKPLLNSYGPAISYRQPIWRDWLYVQTELNYYNDKSANKDHYPAALLRMEALF